MYALSNSDRHYILSAKHFIISPETIIGPYEVTISKFTKAEKLQWGKEVARQLRRLVTKSDHLVVLCGRDYYMPLLDAIRSIGCRTTFPLLGMSLGNRLKALTRLNAEVELERDYEEFYRQLRQLYIAQDGGRILGESTGRINWPRRGIYFLLEPDELLPTRRYSPLLQRIVRVGTHAVSRGSKTTLWDRLSTHRGIMGGGGNHRSSIYRLHVGAALAAKNPSSIVPTWGEGQTPPQGAQLSEVGLEREVSRYMSNVRVLWLDIPDDPGPRSDRAFIERNAIGLLSRYRVASGETSASWPGNYSESVDIATSGLWNLNHLYLRPHLDFIKVLSYYVSSTLGKTPTPVRSVAPTSWYTVEAKTDSVQLNLGLNGPDFAADDP